MDSQSTPVFGGRFQRVCLLGLPPAHIGVTVGLFTGNHSVRLSPNGG